MVAGSNLAKLWKKNRRYYSIEHCDIEQIGKENFVNFFFQKPVILLTPKAHNLSSLMTTHLSKILNCRCRGQEIHVKSQLRVWDFISTSLTLGLHNEALKRHMHWFISNNLL